MNNLLKRKREEKKITQRQLANEVSVSEHYIYLIESGKRRPSYEVATKIAEILGLDWTQFFENNENAS